MHSAANESRSLGAPDSDSRSLRPIFRLSVSAGLPLRVLGRIAAAVFQRFGVIHNVAGPAAFLDPVAGHG